MKANETAMAQPEGVRHHEDAIPAVRTILELNSSQLQLTQAQLNIRRPSTTISRPKPITRR
ncbi:MAG: hypothetical protein ACLUZZ_02880 [Alistipes inops]